MSKLYWSYVIIRDNSLIIPRIYRRSFLILAIRWDENMDQILYYDFEISQKTFRTSFFSNTNLLVLLKIKQINFALTRHLVAAAEIFLSHNQNFLYIGGSTYFFCKINCFSFNYCLMLVPYWFIYWHIHRQKL